MGQIQSRFTGGDNAFMNPRLTSDPWPWRNSFAELGEAFYTRLPAQGLQQPHWVASSPELASELGLGDEWLASNEALQAFAGNALLPGAAVDQSLASVYSGHQFGHWAGQLGDGRALLLGGLRRNLSWPGVGAVDEVEIQLKGAGSTPYSRMGDGRAVLRSSVREFLCSEAMHGLGIPTTRALALAGSPQPVRREEIETAAVVARVAPSFVRFGHFEHFSANDQLNELRTLADHVIARFYPQCRDAARPHAALLEAISQRTCDTIAQWQAVGFCHGVMNTDNMSVLGLTIDYGPFGFLDGFNPDHICNQTDTQGRYAYNKQPNAAYWNLFCLGQALLPLIGDQEHAIAALEPYRTRFPAQLQRLLAAKIGIGGDQAASPECKSVIDALLKLLATERTDWTIFFASFAQALEPGSRENLVRDLFINRDGFDAWLLSYVEHQTQWIRRPSADFSLKSSENGFFGLPEAVRVAAHTLAAHTNPKVVLRNHLAQNAIQLAENGDFSETHRLLSALRTPFIGSVGVEQYTALPPDWAQTLEVSCSS